jgi:GNAT superfamily N-acetyltransferase
MRRIARWGGLGLWLWGMEAEAWGASGFVWLEEGQVVGNVSLRRAASPGGWMVGNVVVHPDRRGRGIGRALMEATVDAVATWGGDWVGLEVHEDNIIALGLYQRMGFEPVGSMLELIRPAGLPWPRTHPAPLHLRRARVVDRNALYRLAQEGLSRPHREVLELRHSAYRVDWEARLAAWLEGGWENWWVAEEGGRISGALRVGSRWPARWHQVEVLVRPEHLDDLGPRLAEAAMAVLSRRRPWETMTVLPGLREALEPAFAAAGFQRARRLVQMRLLLGHCVRVIGSLDRQSR